MSDEISVGDRVEVQGKVGDVVQIDEHDEAKCYHIVLEEGGRKRYFDTVTEIRKIMDPFQKLLSQDFDEWWRFNLLTRATELSLAFEYDQLLSLSNSRINLEPYQVECVHKVINAPKQRFLIADDVGLGKTIEAGMLIKELEARRRANGVLIVVPASLVSQWKREMNEKFDQNYWVYDSSRVKDIKNNIAPHKSVWEHNNRIITSIDYAKQQHVRPMLRDVDWDLIIFDEAHKLSKTEGRTTQRYKLGNLLSKRCENLLLLTATPHNGDRYRFWKLVQLINKYIFSDPSDINSERLRDIMVRRGKEKILDEEGEKVFRPRRIHSLPVEFTEKEQKLYREVTEYVKSTYNKAKKQKNRAIGFAMVILQKRMVSSIESIHSSLKRRMNSLKREHKEITEGEKKAYKEYLKDPDSLDSQEREELEGKILENASYKDPELLEKEIEVLEDLVEEASDLKSSSVDSKGAKLREMIEKIFEENPDEKVLIFTEYTDTLDYLRDTVLKEFDKRKGITEIHGEVNMNLRESREDLFRKGEKQIMLGTDAAGEGINLQFCHLMFNYDLPWNPNRIDQRIGRLHRYGQDKIVQIWNLLVKNTREGQIFNRLGQKVKKIEEDLGQMSDVLGSLLEDVDLEELIMNVVTDKETVNDVNKEIDRAIDERKKMLDQTEDLLMSLREFDLEESLEIIEKSQEITFSNEDIGEFVRTFFDKFGGEIENTRYKKQYRLYPPSEVISDKVPTKIERATFDKEIAKDVDPDDCEFIAFGHPLLDNIIDFCSNRDTKIGGATTFKEINHKNHKGGAGALFNWKVSIVDKNGELVKESLAKTLLNEDGKILELPFSEKVSNKNRKIGENPENLGKLREISFNYAKDKADEMLEDSKEGRESEFEIKREEIEKYFEPRIEEAQKKLEEFKRIPKDEEMREANIGRAKKKLERLEREREKQLKEERSRKKLYVEAPKLLNCALVNFV